MKMMQEPWRGRRLNSWRTRDGADAGVHLDEVGAAGEQERHARFAGDRAREQRLAGARRADEQHALGNAAADRGEALRLAQEVDDFLDLVFRLVDAGDILERDHVRRRARRARARPEIDGILPAVVR